MDKEKRLLLIIASVLLALLLVAVIVKNVITPLPIGLNITFDVIIAISASGIAGLLVALLVDTPQLVRNFKSMLTAALASNEYLEDLPPSKLEVLRKKIVHLVHKNSERVPASFLELDDNLCDLIDAPYYDFLNECFVVGPKKSYKEILTTNRIDVSGIPDVEGEFFEKVVRIEYQIKNPGQNTLAEAVIGQSKFMDLPEECDTKYSYVIKNFEVTIDDGETYDISNSLVIERCKATNGRVGSDPNTMTYDTVVRMSLKDDLLLTSESIKTLGGSIAYKSYDSDTKHEVKAKFADCVRVRVSYSQICPIADSHYTRRLKYSAKHYMISYSCSDDYVLHGQILGTLIKQSDMSIINNEKNNLTMICRNWLLPKNGSFIVMDDVVKKSDAKDN